MDLKEKTQKLEEKLDAMSTRDIELSPDLAEHLEVLDRALDQILDLIDDLLVVSPPPPANPASLTEGTGDSATLDSVVEVINSSSLGSRSEIPVLLVEDNMVNRKLAVLILERIGCTVDVAENGLEGFEKFKSGHYRAVFMDCQMPIMDGYEATLAIRKHEAGMSRIPVIAVTANAMKGDREKCLECGMDDYISKPLRPNDLQEAVTRWCMVNA